MGSYYMVPLKLSEKQLGNENCCNKEVHTKVNADGNVDVEQWCMCSLSKSDKYQTLQDVVINSVAVALQSSSKPNFLSVQSKWDLFVLTSATQIFISYHRSAWKKVWLMKWCTFTWSPDSSLNLFPLVSRKIGAVSNFLKGRAKSASREELSSVCRLFWRVLGSFNSYSWGMKQKVGRRGAYSTGGFGNNTDIKNTHISQ